MQTDDAPGAPKPRGGWGGLGALAGVGSVTIALLLMFATSFLHVMTEHWGVIGLPFSMLHAAFSGIGLFAVPFMCMGYVLSVAERRFGATPKNLNLVFLVAVAIYLAHLPLLFFLLLMTGMTRWPWR